VKTVFLGSFLEKSDLWADKVSVPMDVKEYRMHCVAEADKDRQHDATQL